MAHGTQAALTCPSCGPAPTPAPHRCASRAAPAAPPARLPCCCWWWWACCWCCCCGRLPLCCAGGDGGAGRAWPPASSLQRFPRGVGCAHEWEWSECVCGWLLGGERHAEPAAPPLSARGKRPRQRALRSCTSLAVAAGGQQRGQRKTLAIGSLLSASHARRMQTLTGRADVLVRGRGGGKRAGVVELHAPLGRPPPPTQPSVHYAPPRHRVTPGTAPPSPA